MLNPKIKELSEEHGIPADITFLILFYLQHNLYDDLFEQIYKEEMKSLDFLGIVRRNYEDNTTEFMIPLYVTSDENKEWEWVLEFRQLFVNTRRDAGGSPNACITKMKKFFATNPSVRTEECMKAAKLYISTVSDPKYLQRCDYFITKTINKNEKMSRLEEYLAIIKEEESKQELKINL